MRAPFIIMTPFAVIMVMTTITIIIHHRHHLVIVILMIFITGVSISIISTSAVADDARADAGGDK